MNRQINKSLRQGVIIGLIVLAGVVSFFLYDTIKNPGYGEKEVILFNYDQKADINYEVLLKPNPLHEEESLGEEEVYITEFVDSINLSLNYEYTGEKVKDIKGNYEIVALIEGYTGGEEQIRTIWKRELPIVSKKAFQFEDKEFTLTEDISLNLEEYNTFASQIIKDSKVSSQVRLTVLMNVASEIPFEKDIIEEKVSPAIIIPLNKNYFEMTKNQTGEKPEVIERTEKVKLPVNKQVVTFYSLILIISIIALLIIVKFTVGVKVGLTQKRINDIFKKHGDRLVAIRNEIGTSSEMSYAVQSIDDLVKIADEIEKPIMYKHSSKLDNITKFYVVEESCIYIYDLKEDLGELNLKDK